ncbi:hypothetical protein P152DRAFT_406374 [Eremomyces bilateralis CBS 781.70]|uniref:Uncharacterized protein n=1 Tax=Eremomyces bilateralis CBS 781.70 TaxID=1392243 RepID=A0A6G1FQD0_9PEZI|nr:uncharacterized protein P152DRAFT_406374 [Eremomyces bilateralis CBS 781.70]KAF1807973.1 hypothetical protein P152DRAFT_406374 [Eremomyces bilateralis CBS 781.70]
MPKSPKRDPLRETVNVQPVFGQPTPPKNRSGGMSHLFNVPKPGQPRPEHHRPQQTQTLNASAGVQPGTAAYGAAMNSALNPTNSQRPGSNGLQHGHSAPAFRYPPGFAPAYTPAMSQQPTAHQRPVAIQRPSNPPYPYQPATKPVFSAHAHGGFTAVNIPSRNTIDLTGDGDDVYGGFDPNKAFGDDKFGAPDPFQYRDPDQADKDLKDLLSGHFGDDEDVPKLRLRKRKVAAAKKEEKRTGADALAAKLGALDVKDKEEEKKAEEDEDEDEEDGTVDGLAVKLLPHQVEGVAWMIDRENGKRKKNGVLPRGGILADDMGVGKTIQAIALIMTNPRPVAELSAATKPTTKKDKMPSSISKCTLIVAPVAVVSQWQEEIKDKVSPGHAPRVLVHHGAKRSKSAKELEKHDIVITTFGILHTEHAASSNEPDGPKAPLFGVRWYRVILDEAQNIKNRSAKCTQAAYALDSWYRWCLTGTPMQNNLDELQSLIRFLRIKPYSDFKMWKEQISGPLKNGRGNLAMKRLNYFLKAIMKRRLKTILQEPGALSFGKKAEDEEHKKSAFTIVDKTVEIIEAEFNERERRFYERLVDRAQANLNQMMGAERKDYIGALVLLLRLRQACNHPDLVGEVLDSEQDALDEVQTVPQTPRKTTGQSEDIDDLANMLGGLSVVKKKCDVCQITIAPEAVRRGELRCEECEDDLADQSPREDFKKGSSKHGSKKSDSRRNRRVVLDSDEEEEEEADWVVPESERQVADLGKAGGTDDEDVEGGGESINSEDSDTDEESEERTKPSRTRHRGPIELSSGSEGDSDEDGLETVKCPMTSTKIRYLLGILEKETPEHKVIVFSQFTSMLNLIEPFLHRSGYRFVRYDGSMRPDVRDYNINQLRNDKKTRILLCSLKCGGVGLNLTAASRVVLVEPFWNPFAESQAIDRVHRINQTKAVHVYRLTVADTVEAKILRLQEAKQALANAAIEGGSRKDAQKLSFEDILKLFGRDAETKHDEENRRYGRVDERLHQAGSQAIDLVRQVARTGGSQGRAERVEHPVYGRR